MSFLYWLTDLSLVDCHSSIRTIPFQRKTHFYRCMKSWNHWMSPMFPVPSSFRLP